MFPAVDSATNEEFATCECRNRWNSVAINVADGINSTTVTVVVMVEVMRALMDRLPVKAINSDIPTNTKQDACQTFKSFLLNISDELNKQLGERHKESGFFAAIGRKMSNY